MPTLARLFLRNLSSRSLTSARAVQMCKHRAALLRTKVIPHFAGKLFTLTPDCWVIRIAALRKAAPTPSCSALAMRPFLFVFQKCFGLGKATSMRLSFSVFLLVNALALLSPSPLPAQNAKFVVAPSGAGRAEQSKTSNASQNLLDPQGEFVVAPSGAGHAEQSKASHDPQSLRNTQGEMPEGITTSTTTNTTTNKLKAKIMTALERAYVTSAFKIAVTTLGRVVIEGEVPSYWDKQNVFAIVARVPGVKDISNRLVVQTLFVSAPIVKVELEEYLKRMRVIKDLNKITVTVRMPEGQVILGGTVNFPHEKALMEEIAAWHRGVKEVDNQIEVLSMGKIVSDADLIRIIKNMLSCDFPFEEKTVQIKIEKGRAVLSGAVSRLWAKLEIEKAVQNTAGVRQVENRLEVIYSAE